MNTENVNRTNEIINFAGQIRETLCINGFYTEDRLCSYSQPSFFSWDINIGYRHS